MWPIPLNSNLTVLYESVLPGFIGLILGYPLLPKWARIESGYIGFAGLALLVGFSVRLIMMNVLNFSFGAHWPSRMRKYAVKRLQAKVDTILDRKKKVANTMLSLTEGGFQQERFLAAFPEFTIGKKTVLAPTVVGNTVLTLVYDLLKHAMMTGLLIKKGSTLDALDQEALLARFFQSYFFLPKEVRDGLRESTAVATGLLGLAVISAAVVIGYLVSALSVPAMALRDLLFAVPAAVVGRAAYITGTLELTDNLGIQRRILFSLKEEDLKRLREILIPLAEKAMASQKQQPDPKGT